MTVWPKVTTCRDCSEKYYVYELNECRICRAGQCDQCFEYYEEKHTDKNDYVCFDCRGQWAHLVPACGYIRGDDMDYILASRTQTRVLCKALKVTTAELRRMSRGNELTADRIEKALGLK